MSWLASRADRPRIRSDAEAGPASLHGSGIDIVDDDHLLSALGAGDDPNVPTRDPERIGDEADQSAVRGTFHGRGGHPGSKDAVNDAVNAVVCRPGGQAHREADIGRGQDVRRRATGNRG